MVQYQNPHPAIWLAHHRCLRQDAIAAVRGPSGDAGALSSSPWEDGGVRHHWRHLVASSCNVSVKLPWLHLGGGHVNGRCNHPKIATLYRGQQQLVREHPKAGSRLRKGWTLSTVAARRSSSLCHVPPRPARRCVARRRTQGERTAAMQREQAEVSVEATQRKNG